MFHSNTHEVIRAGTSRVIRFGDRIPSSLIHSENVEFMNRSCVVINNINLDKNGANYWLFETRNALAVVRCPFFTANGDLVGFVGVDFIESRSSHSLLETKSALEKTALALGLIYDHK
jgi:hypothetical protein